jgi:hypothetical protein
MTQIIGMPRNWLVARILVQCESEVQEKRHAHAIRTWMVELGRSNNCGSEKESGERDVRRFSLDVSEMFVIR